MKGIEIHRIDYENVINVDVMRGVREINKQYLLFGDILIEMDFFSNCNQENSLELVICGLNAYKPVQRIEYNNKIGCLFVFQASCKTFLIDFEFIAQLLINYPEQSVHSIGVLILKYQEIIKLLHLQVRNTRSMNIFQNDILARRR